ncbi:MAG: hypothetical protein QOE26_2918 [Verrucomicrobiota bacterium]
MHRIRYIFAWTTAAILLYTVLYVALPDRVSWHSPYLEHHRKFRYGFETGLFLPAAYGECGLLRMFPRLYRASCAGKNGAQFVALDWKYPAFRLQATPNASRDAVLRSDDDIAEHVATIGFYRPGERRLSDGSTVTCKYIDCDLDRAEEFLGPTFPRPWRILETLARYRSAPDNNTRIHLLNILAASQDPRAALVLADALNSPDLSPIAADKLTTYYVVCCIPDGLEGMFTCAKEWLKENRKQLEEKCAHL